MVIIWRFRAAGCSTSPVTLQATHDLETPRAQHRARQAPYSDREAAVQSPCGRGWRAPHGLTCHPVQRRDARRDLVPRLREWLATLHITSTMARYATGDVRPYNLSLALACFDGAGRTSRVMMRAMSSSLS